MVVVDVCAKTNEVTAPSNKPNSTVKGRLGVETTRGYFVIVQIKAEHLDHTALTIR